jgi:hypothetical protein
VEQLLRRCFAARRKMLRNTLAGLLPTPELLALAEAAGVQLEQRPQELAPERWLALAAGWNRTIPAAAAPAVPFLNKTGVSAGAVRLSALLAQQTTFSSRCAYAAR